MLLFLKSNKLRSSTYTNIALKHAMTVVLLVVYNITAVHVLLRKRLTILVGYQAIRFLVNWIFTHKFTFETIGYTCF